MVEVKWGDSRQLDEGGREAVERGAVDGEGAEQISQEATQLTPVLLLGTTGRGRCIQGPHTSGYLKFKAIQDFSRLFEK